ncbi:hypothetical protein [Ramlibacter sp.]|uniref:hypothetical protein n=1 Tax=Ramlibacter sp. TaxID=1917967 RepID=UPI0025DFE105|nr:hypothetical protein [Ramlibacter sp.]
MLARQHSGGAGSIHDDAVAAGLGLGAGTIEGPTHFSQIAFLCARAWGREWFETGCLSVKFKAPSHAGDEVRAALRWPVDPAGLNDVWVVKRDGIDVLRGSASAGPSQTATALRQGLLRTRRRALGGADDAPMVGRTSGRIAARLSFDARLGALYPFSLNEKLAAMTQPHPWYTKEAGGTSPWGRPVVPLEMVSVLLRHGSGNFPFPADYPFVQMFAAQEIRLHAGPLFVDCPYELEHTVVAANQLRQLESTWIHTDVFAQGAMVPLATMLLNIVGFTGKANESSPRTASGRA